MAITKIHAIKSTLNKALNYIENPDKTDDELLISGYNVDPQFASVEFEMTAALAGEIKGDYTNTGGGNNLAYHLIQSFAPYDKITPQQAHEIGKKLADEFLNGKYEYVLTTHVDKGHIHNHIIINATSFYDYKKLETTPYKTAKQLRTISDKLCAENGLYVIKEPKEKGKSYTEWQQRNSKTSWKALIETAIDNAILKANDYEQFKEILKASGVDIKEGKHISFKLNNADQERFTRGKTIGELYTREAIIKRIAQPKEIKESNRNIETNTAPTPMYDKQIEYAARKTRLEETKELANALLTIRREKIQNYNDFDLKINSIVSQISDVKGTIKGIDNKNFQYKEAAKYLLTINKYLPIKQDLAKQTIFTKKGYEKKFESELLAYNHAVTQLEKLNVNTNVDPEKVLTLIKDQDGKVSELSLSVQQIEMRLNEIRQAQKIVDIINGEHQEEVKARKQYIGQEQI